MPSYLIRLGGNFDVHDCEDGDEALAKAWEYLKANPQVVIMNEEAIRTPRDDDTGVTLDDPYEDDAYDPEEDVSPSASYSRWRTTQRPIRFSIPDEAVSFEASDGFTSRSTAGYVVSTSSTTPSLRSVLTEAGREAIEHLQVRFEQLDADGIPRTRGDIPTIVNTDDLEEVLGEEE